MAFNGNNPPTNIDLAAALSSLNVNDSAAKGCRFLVRINLGNLTSQLPYAPNIKGDLHFACDAAEFPGRSFEVSEYRYYGPKQLVPGNTVYGEGITLSFICRSKTMERQFFDDWMDIINPPTSYHFKYPNEYWCDIEVFQFGEFGSNTNVSLADAVKGIPRNANPANRYQAEPIYGWKIMKAWPVSVNPQQVTWADSDVLRLQVSFAFKNWTRHGDIYKVAEKFAKK